MSDEMIMRVALIRKKIAGGKQIMLLEAKNKGWISNDIHPETNQIDRISYGQVLSLKV